MKIYVLDIDGNLLFIPTIFYMEEISTGVIKKFKSWECGDILPNMKKLGLKFQRNHAYSMRNFRGKQGDKSLLKEIKNAKYGPSWTDFVTCVNNGDFFSVITARGNSLKCLREVFKQLIQGNTNGLLFDSFIKNIMKNNVFIKMLEVHNKKPSSDDEILDFYLEYCCSFYGRNSKDTKAMLKGLNMRTSTPEFKLLALKDFERKMSEIIKIASVDVVSEIIELGFSDDEEPNCLAIKEYCENSESIFKKKVYFTGKGSKNIIF